MTRDQPAAPSSLDERGYTQTLRLPLAARACAGPATAGVERRRGCGRAGVAAPGCAGPGLGAGERCRSPRPCVVPRHPLYREMDPQPPLCDTRHVPRRAVHARRWRLRPKRAAAVPPSSGTEPPPPGPARCRRRQGRAPSRERSSGSGAGWQRLPWRGSNTGPNGPGRIKEGRARQPGLREVWTHTPCAHSRTARSCSSHAHLEGVK